MSRTEELQNAFEQYELAHNHMPAGTRQVVDWAVEHDILKPPKIDPLDILATQMSNALRQQRGVHKGKRYRVNQATRFVNKEGVQYTLWASGKYALKSHTVMWFNQRREQIVNDCCRMKIDVDVYNDMNSDQEPYQFVMDFTDDAAEREMMGNDDDDYNSDDSLF